VAQQLLTGKVSRALATNRSPFLATALANARSVPLFTPSGLYVENIVSVPLDADKIRRLLEFMAKGLYFWVKNERIPDSYEYQVDRLRREGIQVMWDALEGRSEGVGRIGRDVFACRYLFASEDPFISYWLLVFYNSIAYTVTVVPQGGIPEEGDCHP
jgi:hypothetical protein